MHLCMHVKAEGRQLSTLVIYYPQGLQCCSLMYRGTVITLDWTPLCIEAILVLRGHSLCRCLEDLHDPVKLSCSVDFAGFEGSCLVCRPIILLSALSQAAWQQHLDHRVADNDAGQCSEEQAFFQLSCRHHLAYKTPKAISGKE